MAKRKGKRFGFRGFTVEDNPGAVAELLRANERFLARIAARRKAKGLRPDANAFIYLEGEGDKA